MTTSYAPPLAPAVLNASEPSYLDGRSYLRGVLQDDPARRRAQMLPPVVTTARRQDNAAMLGVVVAFLFFWQWLERSGK